MVDLLEQALQTLSNNLKEISIKSVFTPTTTYL